MLLVFAFRTTAPADWWRGLAVVCLAITGVVFNLLLRGVMPIAMIFDWLTVPPRDAIAWPSALRWLLFPLAWLAWTLLRDPIAGWYPYTFLDVSWLGAASVAETCAEIATSFVATSAAVKVTGNRKAPRL